MLLIFASYTVCRRADLANQSFIVFNPIRLKMLGFCFPVRSDGRILSQSDNNGKMFRVSSRNISKKRERENLRKRIRDQAPIQTGSNVISNSLRPFLGEFWACKVPDQKVYICESFSKVVFLPVISFFTCFFIEKKYLIRITCNKSRQIRHRVQTTKHVP